MRLVGFITEPATVRQILEHLGEPTSAPAIAPARLPPLEMKIGQELAAPKAVFEAIHGLEFYQTANLTAEARPERLLHYVGIDAEPIPELEFDQTLGWIRHWRGAVNGVVCQCRKVGSVHSLLVTRIKSPRTPNKSDLWPGVNGWLGLAQSGALREWVQGV